MFPCVHFTLHDKRSHQLILYDISCPMASFPPSFVYIIFKANQRHIIFISSILTCILKTWRYFYVSVRIIPNKMNSHALLSSNIQLIYTFPICLNNFFLQLISSLKLQTRPIENTCLMCRFHPHFNIIISNIANLNFAVNTHIPQT